MSQFQYPLHFQFRISTLSNDFVATDAFGSTIFYVREKMFTFRDRIKVYNDKTKSELLYELTSNKRIDFQQTFTISDVNGRLIGKVRRKTIKSLWRSTFHLSDPQDRVDHTIKEKNPWVKLGDGLFGEIPILGMLSGYVFNPSYVLRTEEGEELFEIKKEASFFGRKFSINKLTEKPIDEERFVLSLMMLVLTERTNG